MTGSLFSCTFDLDQSKFDREQKTASLVNVWPGCPASAGQKASHVQIFSGDVGFHHNSSDGNGQLVSTHKVRFDQVSFTCGEITQSGKVVRFIRSDPGAKYIPEFRPAASDPLAKSWDITYRIICEGGYRQPSITPYWGEGFIY